MSTRILGALILMLLSLQLFGQREYMSQYQYQDLFPVHKKFMPSGWFFSPGITYQLIRFQDPEVDRFENNDTLITSIEDPRGKLGLYLDVGRYHITDKSLLLEYIDYGIHVKQFRGAEQYTGMIYNKPITEEQEPSDIYEGEGHFTQWYGGAFFNANHVWQISDYRFIQNSLGVNVDFRFANNHGYENPNPLMDQHALGQPFMAQLHYKLAYGFKVNQQVFVIPALETPILTALPWSNGRSTYGFFSSRFRPLILSVRILFLRERGKRDCPPVYGDPTEDDIQQKIFK